MNRLGMNAPVMLINRRNLVATGIAAALLTGPAYADASAERYIGDILEEANALFANADEAARLAGIDALVDKYVDMERVARFVLGKHARQISDAQRAEYLPLFRKFATVIYRNTLTEYAGQALEIVGSVDRSPRDIIVDTRIKDAKPGEPFAGLIVNWRVRRDPSGAMSVVDAGANGIFLAIEQRSQFDAVIANNGGGSRGIDALIAELKSRVGSA